MRTFIALLLWLAIVPAWSHQEGEPAAAAYFDCDHLAADALAREPAELAPYSRIECTPRGQLLMAGDGWTWRFPGSFFDLPSIAAYAPRASQRNAEPRYFRSISISEVAADERAQLHQRFARELGTYGTARPPQRMLHAAVVNDAGHAFDVFIPFESEDKAWVISCVPDCPPEYVFMMERLEQ